ncbi:hypothetical protein BpHYR1_041894 [Brachionus plicatilis]|uniref:Uncharacterized protein n=1 Tax=Brachionus plicatilis TaxID=10195 RepID=A0A3M7S173_BRAPC|nr:hypothetical protein BpHYR1_041894 [Brachionus plicatilis]
MRNQIVHISDTSPAKFFRNRDRVDSRRPTFRRAVIWTVGQAVYKSEKHEFFAVPGSYCGYLVKKHSFIWTRIVNFIKK